MICYSDQIKLKSGVVLTVDIFMKAVKLPSPALFAVRIKAILLELMKIEEFNPFFPNYKIIQNETTRNYLIKNLKDLFKD